jgi:hypothetical protein
MFFCDPFGHTQPENLYNIGSDPKDQNFIYFHDQEPVHQDVHLPLLLAVQQRNLDLRHGQGPKHAAIVVSEKHSDIVTQICSRYQWRVYNYFFHGWAALDWYRGYDKTFLAVPLQQRNPSRIFFNPNRIIDGHRNHRIQLMYYLIKQGVTKSYMSFPAQCPGSGRKLLDIVKDFEWMPNDMIEVLDRANFPWNLPGEHGHPMHSHKLSRFDLAADSEIYVVTETVAQGKRQHLTEKIFKPICMQMPFILVSTANSLEYLRSYGFRTFGDIWDESYDCEPNDIVRVERVAQLMKHIQDLPQRQRRNMMLAAQQTVTYNFNHFYHGDFERLLWRELTDMLNTMAKDFNVT